ILTTRGRRSGSPRTVMLDVIGHDAARDVWYVQPADGHRAHWLRNLRAHPEAKVEVLGRTFEAHAVDVTGSEGAEIILRFIREPRSHARLLACILRYVDPIDQPDAALRKKLQDVPVIALQALPRPH